MIVGVAFLVMLLTGGPQRIAGAQEVPPEQIPDVLDTGLRPDAFYFLDELGLRTMWPDMTFEKIDRMVKADAGFAQPSKPYSFERISITGSAEADRAELAVTVQLSVSPTPGQSIVVPLRMEGFHQTSPADVTGVEQYGMDLSLEQGGYLLWVRADQPRKVEVRMRVVTRARGDNGSGIDFHLPAAPTHVSLAVRGDDMTASAVGRGDEVVRVEPGAPGETKVNLESSGGSFTLNWRQHDAQRTSDQVLEVDSRQRVSWDDPQAPPTAVAEFTVHNRRGNVGPFEIQLPERAELLEPLQGNAAVQLAISDTNRGRVVVTPSDSDPASRVQVTIEYRLPSGDYHAEEPLNLRPLRVPTAVRHSGEIEIRVDQNYRLRWLQRPNVRSATRTAATDPADTRVYLFQYDRVPFELPVWLAAKQQRLRVDQQYNVRVSDTVATLEATITAAGTIIEGVPLIVHAPGWQTTTLEDLETGRSLEGGVGGVDTGLELELGELVPGTNSAVGVRWVAVMPVPPDDDRLGFSVPTVNSVDDRTVFISPGTLVLSTDDGLGIVTDAERSQGLSSLAGDAGAQDAGASALRFRVQPVGVPPAFHGFLIENPPEASIEASLHLAAEGNALAVSHHWVVTPRVSLRGQLPITLGNLVGISDGESPTESEVVWEATVNGGRAAMRWNGTEEAVIYSNEFNGQPSRVEIAATIPLPVAFGRSPESDAVAEIAVPLPRPNFDGGTLAGTFRTEAVDSSALEVAIPEDGRGTSAIMEYLAEGTVPVRVAPRTITATHRTVIERAVIRSEIGRTRRFDRLTVRVTGGSDSLTVPFADWAARQGDEDVTVRAYVGGVEIAGPSFADGTVTVPLPVPEPESGHVVDLRMWRSRDGNLTGGLVRPVFDLPHSTGKTYWDVVLPSDRHLIWSASGTGALMRWQYQQMFVRRVPVRSYADLMDWVGASTPPESQLGTSNRYLLVSSDPGSLQLAEAGRPLLWVVVGGAVLAISGLLFYVPRLRHPLMGIAGAVMLGGLAWLAPDLAVISGQLVIASLLLVAVMAGVRAIMIGRPRATVFGGVPPESASEQSGSARRGSATSEPVSSRLQETLATGSAPGVHS